MKESTIYEKHSATRKPIKKAELNQMRPQTLQVIMGKAV